MFLYIPVSVQYKKDYQSLCVPLSENHSMNIYGGVELKLQTLLTLEESIQLYPQRKTYWFLLDTKISGLKCWSEPDCKEKNCYLCQESKHGPPVCSWSLYRMSYLSSERKIKSFIK